jgi:hypothetical protein
MGRRVYAFSGHPPVKDSSKMSHINSGSCPLGVFLLFCVGDMQVLVVETNFYYQECCDKLEDGSSPLPDVTEAEVFLFVVHVLQMGHDVRDILTDCWSKVEQFYTLFCSNALKQYRILHLLHFEDFTKEIARDDKNHDRLWKIREIFEIQ